MNRVFDLDSWYGREACRVLRMRSDQRRGCPFVSVPGFMRLRAALLDSGGT